MNKVYKLILIVFCVTACDKNDVDQSLNPEALSGTGAYNFNYTAASPNKSLNVFYHIPSGDQSQMPVLVVFHGASRNAAEYRNAWINVANAEGFMVIVPEFSNQDFPGGDGYNLGNVFVDGDNPSSASLNPEQDWAFSIVEPLIADFKIKAQNETNRFNIFGFSAGAQFAHRLIMFKPNLNFNKAVVSAAGWYTVPGTTEDFPYGINASPIAQFSASSYLSKDVTIQIGALDDNPSAPSLRRNSTVDQQGDNRYDRAFYMFDRSQNYAQEEGVNFNWQIITTPNNAHDFTASVTQAAGVLFE